MHIESTTAMVMHVRDVTRGRIGRKKVLGHEPGSVAARKPKPRMSQTSSFAVCGKNISRLVWKSKVTICNEEKKRERKREENICRDKGND